MVLKADKSKVKWPTSAEGLFAASSRYGRWKGKRVNAREEKQRRNGGRKERG
jgi:hypothetical protein